MGLADREYYQDERGTGIHVGAPTMIVNLLIVNVVIFLANMLFGGTSQRITQALALDGGDILAPWMWWRLLTYGFTHDPAVAGHIAVNLFMLWMFGRDVEQVLGPRRLLVFYLVTIVLGGVVWSLRQWLFASELGIHRQLIGASGGVTAIVLTYVLLFPTRTIYLFLFLPVPAWVVGILYVVTDLSGVTAAGGDNLSHVAFDVHLTGALAALIQWRLGPFWERFFGGAGRGARRSVPRRGVPAAARTGTSAGRTSSRSKWALWNPFRKRPNLRVHEPTPDTPTGPSVLDEQADSILQKVAQKGMDSLSPSERRTLEAYSRRMRQKHQ